MARSQPACSAPPADLAWDVRRRWRKDVLAGLLFMAVAASGCGCRATIRSAPRLRMGTGYVPRLLCWVLLGARRR